MTDDRSQEGVVEHVVVGVDESDGAAAALRWAVAEGELHGWRVTAVMAWGFLDQHHTIAGVPFEPDYGEKDAEEALDAVVVRAVGDGAAADRVGRRIVCDLPAPALLDASKDAALLVVGARGMGGFKGLLLGSVSQQCLRNATVPIAVVRAGSASSSASSPARGRVVVAVDGSDTAARALGWAVEEARVRSARLAVVHAWHPPYVGGQPYDGTFFDPQPFQESARHVLETALADVDVQSLTHPPEPIVARGGAADAILSAGADADVIVLGSRGRGELEGLLLGSVTSQVIHHADTTVVVVPAVGSGAP